MLLSTDITKSCSRNRSRFESMLPRLVILDRCLSISSVFFDLDEEPKMKLYQEDPMTHNMGYRPLNAFNIAHTVDGDQLEGFSVQSRKADDARPCNKWPPEVPTLREAVLDDKASVLGNKLYGAISLAMCDREDFFEDKAKYQLSRMRLMRYPEHSKEVIGVGQHSDFGTMTILLQQPKINSLQVSHPDNGWTQVPPLPGTLVVNLADQIEIYTNGVFKSPLHRVVSPPGITRHSVALFLFADFDVVLKPDDHFITIDRPCQYEPMIAEEQLEKRTAASSAN
ncbi:hypothetical protein C8R43DRAFT_1118702 [Mycena crocata]|nr:hypothetical protein C8R43DRAFT_1118702 [Mycena crocata]